MRCIQKVSIKLVSIIIRLFFLEKYEEDLFAPFFFVYIGTISGSGRGVMDSERDPVRITPFLLPHSIHIPTSSGSPESLAWDG